MSLNYVTLTLDLYDGQGNFPVSGLATFTPSAVLTDAGVEIIGQQPVQAVFHAAALPAVSLLATDNAGPLPAGWTWSVAFSGIAGAPAGFSFFLPFAGGASQLMSNLIPVSSGSSFAGYMPLAGGQFTGAVEPAAVTLADAATILVNAALGNLFRVTLGGNRTLASPAGGADGQLIRIEVIQDGTGGRTLSYGPAYAFGSAGAPTLSTTPAAMDVLGIGYDSGAAKWRVLAFAGGF